MPSPPGMIHSTLSLKLFSTGVISPRLKASYMPLTISVFVIEFALSKDVRLNQRPNFNDTSSCGDFDQAACGPAEARSNHQQGTTSLHSLPAAPPRAC